MCSDFVHLAWADQQSRRISYVGLLEDVSPDGLCVNLDVPVPVGKTIHLHTKGFQGEAEVRYCELGDYGYQVGVEFVDGCTWDRDKWRPKHLLNIEGNGQKV
jgi:hypothetical protein